MPSNRDVSWFYDESAPLPQVNFSDIEARILAQMREYARSMQQAAEVAQMREYARSMQQAAEVPPPPAPPALSADRLGIIRRYLQEEEASRPEWRPGPNFYVGPAPEPNLVTHEFMRERGSMLPGQWEYVPTLDAFRRIDTPPPPDHPPPPGPPARVYPPRVFDPLEVSMADWVATPVWQNTEPQNPSHWSSTPPRSPRMPPSGIKELARKIHNEPKRLKGFGALEAKAVSITRGREQ